MGRLTPEMIARILEEYQKTPSYKKVAERLGIDWKTVRYYVKKSKEVARSTSAKEPNTPAPRAYLMFSQGATMLQVAVSLDADYNEVRSWRLDYQRLTQQDELLAAFEEIKSDIGSYLAFYRELKSRKMSVGDVILAKNNVASIQAAQIQLKELQHRFEGLKGREAELIREIEALHERKWDLER